MCGACYIKHLKARNPGVAKRQNENARRWALAHPDRIKVIRDRYLSKPHAKHKIRQAKQTEARNAQLAAQDGACGLCGNTKVRRWHWDHDHATGKMRLVLCSRCNNGLGFFDDSAAMLRKAAAYLSRFSRKRSGKLSGAV
jgi:DNA-directed RNA polymerase subunit M/transcription elongation factor TFIIS